MMFVPSNRLLWLVFYAALVAAGAGPLPALRLVWFVALGVITAMALTDIVMTRLRSRPPGISLPGVMRFMRDREGVVLMTFLNPSRRARRVKVALTLPAEFESKDEEVWIDLPSDTARAAAKWRCIPRRRGCFRGVIAWVETESMLGLWRVRQKTPQPSELRVHPNLMSERRHVAALFLPRGRPGMRIQRTLGRGREFEKLREYQPGDGFDEIHWKATAKRGKPVTKVFQVERTQEICVVVDASRLSSRPLVHDGILYIGDSENHRIRALTL